MGGTVVEREGGRERGEGREKGVCTRSCKHK